MRVRSGASATRCIPCSTPWLTRSRTLKIEYHMLVAGLKRVEERLDRVEQKLDKMALRSELLELKSRVDGLQEQVRTLEGRLDG